MGMLRNTRLEKARNLQKSRSTPVFVGTEAHGEQRNILVFIVCDKSMCLLLYEIPYV